MLSVSIFCIVHNMVLPFWISSKWALLANHYTQWLFIKSLSLLSWFPLLCPNEMISRHTVYQWVPINLSMWLCMKFAYRKKKKGACNTAKQSMALLILLSCVCESWQLGSDWQFEALFVMFTCILSGFSCVVKPL